MPKSLAARLSIVISAALALILVAGLAWHFLAPVARDGAAVSIGGPFELVDQHGQEVTQADFRGRYMLVYFGYTYCPDVCPTELQTMSQALDKLGDEAEQVTPVFITVDPERDTVEQLAAYAEHFHPRLVALTGSPEQIAAAAKAYRVYYRKAEDDSASDYLMDHSNIVYLMDPEGRFVTHFGGGTGPERMAEQIGEYL